MKIAFFSDIHANLPALDAFFQDIDKVQPDALYCLGDLVGYNVWANEVVEAIRKRRIPTIMGNHEEALLLPTEENDRSNRGITGRLLTAENKHYLMNLPRHLQLDFETNGERFRFLLVHGSPKAVNDYLVEDYPESEITEMMNAHQAQVVLCGHTHIPYHRTIKTGIDYMHVVNIGSVGRPKDGDSRLCYALITLDENFSKHNPNAIRVEFRRVSYEIDTAVKAIEESEFPDEYADLLMQAK